MDEVARGQEAYGAGAWKSAHEHLSAADRAGPLQATVLERAHHAHLETGEALLAARCAFWIGINLMLREEMSPATGWLGRAQRLVAREGSECVERGYLL